MKKAVLYLFLWSLSFAPIAESFAQSHFVRFSLDEGYVNEHPFKPNNENFFSAGSATAAGIGYRLAYHRFLFDVGLGGGFTFVSNQVSDSVVSDFAAAENDQFLLGVDTLFASRHDKIHRLSLQVPIMFGAEWQRFYAMAGLKVQVSFWNKQCERGERRVNITGMYAQDPHTGLLISASDMDTHEIQSLRTPYNWPTDVPSAMLDLRVCAEIGWRLNSREEQGYFNRNDYYLSAFAEYGFPNLYHTTYAQLVVGVRFTAVWQIKGHGRCLCLTD